MPDEVTLDVTTIEENVTVETTAGDVVEIQVLAPTGNAATVAVGTTTTGAAGTNASVTNSGTTSAAVFNFTIPRGDTGATGAAGPNSVTSATTSDGTANLAILTATVGSALVVGDGDSVKGRYDIFANTNHFQWYSDSALYGEREFVITTENLTSSGAWTYKYPVGSGTFALTASTTGVPDKLTDGTIAGTLTLNSTSYTYGTGAAAAHRTALGLTTLATTTPAANVATFLATPSSANLAAAVTDETGSGSLVFGTSPTLTTPTIAAINGGTAANDDITIQGTTNATRTTSYVNLQPSGGNVGIGTITPAQKLDVSGNINIPTTTSTVGAYMINGTRFAHNYGINNTFIGTGSGNTSFNTLYNVANVAVGANALSSLNGTSTGQGSFNFGLGAGAGIGITTGSSNILIGNSVGTNITTTSFNTIIGDAAALGATGLSGVVYVGRGVGRGISTFTDSVFLGTVSGGTTDGGLQTVSGLTNAIAIGARSFVGASHTMALGSVGAYAVDIVSGGSVASAKLHLIKTTEQLRLGYDASNAVKFTVGASNAFTIAPLVNSTTAFNVTNAGGTSVFNIDSTNSRVGIGTTSPTAALDVNSDTVRVRTARTPASATATGNAGDICWDANYIYVCTATNTWKRTLIATWV
jgi:hypothetical protein